MTTRRFDAPTLEAALAQVRAELGPDARITGAEKVRQGGIGGFFARERVEVAVEVADQPTISTPAPARRARASAARPARSPRAAASPASILDLADSVSDEEHDSSVETTSFAAVLERIAGDADMAVAAQTAIEPEMAPAAAPAFTSAPVFAPADFPPVIEDEPFVAERPLAAEPVAAAEPMVDDEPVTAPVAVVGAIVPATAEVVPAPAAPPDQATHAAAGAVAVPRHVGQLQRLGLPGDLLPYDENARGLHCALVDALGLLPAAPPLPAGRGTVLAVVGERTTATALARALATEMRLDTEEIVLCSQRRRGRTSSWLELSSIADADEHRRSWRWRPQPTVVVVDAPPVGRAYPWARDVLSVLEPTSAWGVVDATRKLEDVACWSDELGGLDAFAVTHLADTVSPATVLHLGVPVALLDGEPASPELWADVLMERLAA